MIHEEILRKIIRDNNGSKIDTQCHRNETGTLSWSESRIQLRDFISDLDWLTKVNPRLCRGQKNSF